MSKQVKAEFSMSDAGKFPLESCREKLARRYGEAAVCLSGPCEGKSLADCVCKEMKQRWTTIEQRFAGNSAKIEKLAMDLGAELMSPDNTNECIADLQAMGWEKTAASGIAEYLKADAMPTRMDEVFAQMMGGGMGGGKGGMPGMNTGGEVETAGMMGGMAGGGMSMGTEGSPEPGMDAMNGMGDGMGDMVDLPMDNDMAPGGMDSPEAPMPGMDHGMGGDGMDGMGMDGMDTVTLELPSDVVSELIGALQNASGGMGGGMDSGAIELVGDGDGDMDDLNNDVDDVVLELDGDDEDNDGDDDKNEIPGEPKNEQGDDDQFVTNDGDDKKDDKGSSPFGDEDKKKEEAMALRAGHLTRVGQTVLKLGPEMSINNTDQEVIHTDKELGAAKEKDVEKPKALEDNVKPEGHTAGGNKFQDGKTMGAEEKFDPKTVAESEYTNMSGSLMGKESKPDFKTPSVPAGGGRMGNEAETPINMSTKGTVIATIVPDGVMVQAADGKKYHAKRDISKKASKQYIENLSKLLGKIDATDGRKFAQMAHKAMKLAETSGNVDGVTMIDTAKKEGSEFTNDGEKKPAEGGAMVGNGGAKQDKETPTTDTSKKESEHFQNDAEKKPEEGGVMTTAGKDLAAAAVKVAEQYKNPNADKKDVVSDAGKEVGKPKPMDEQVETEGFTAGGNKFQDGKTMGAEEKFDPKTVAESDVSKMSTSLMGKEEDPGFKSPKVPAGSENPEEHYKPEGDVKTKGTVIAENQLQKREVEEAVAKAQNEAKIREGRIIAASVYVSELLANGEITSSQYAEELNKYAALPVPAIQALAMSTRKARERINAKFAASASKETRTAGLGIPLVISGSSNEETSSLTERIGNLFKLTKDMNRLDEESEKK